MSQDEEGRQQQQEAGGPRSRHSKTPRSLAISPNLNLLAEHEERIRRMSSSPISPASPLSAPGSGGLPPPPRGPRSQRGHGLTMSEHSPISQQGWSRDEDESETQSGLSPLGNPYINPLPLRESDGDIKDKAGEVANAGNGRSPETEKATSGPSDALDALSPTPSATGKVTVPRVDKFLSLGRSSSKSWGENKSGSASPVQSVTQTESPGGSSRSRKRKLVKKSAPASPTSSISTNLDMSPFPPAVLSLRPLPSSSPSFSSTDESRGPSLDSPMARDRTRRPSPPKSDDHIRDSWIDLGSPPVHPMTRTVSADNRSHSPKPPLPTTPKPDFSNARQRSLRHPTLRESSLPPTSNVRDPQQRSDLIKRSQKLAKVFGETPLIDDFAQRVGSEESLPALLESRSRSDRGHKRGAMSVGVSPLPLPAKSNSTSTSTSTSTSEWPHFEGTQYVTVSGSRRRHSSPLTPDDFTFLSSMGDDSAPPRDRRSSPTRTSFIELSDEEAQDDVTPTDDAPPRGRSRPIVSPSSASFADSLTPEQQAEEDRRIKRDRLAKLHRFLGSRVPADLVLGGEDPTLSLPAVSTTVIEPGSMSAGDDANKRPWIKRRRSSSIAAFPSTWMDDWDRQKEDLNDEEKAINVRRAQKMEKLFGVAPPQGLYHTRHSPSPSQPPTLSSVGRSHSGGHSSRNVVDLGDAPPITRNPNQSSYSKKSSKRRPGTADSDEKLIPKDRRESVVYSHYEHSLNSLNDIIDRDDVASLHSLREYMDAPGAEGLNLDRDSPTIPNYSLPPVAGSSAQRRTSNASLKSERRRSMPVSSRASVISVASDFTITSPEPQVTDFQLRRRKANKLTNFFGVDYRDLISDVLESIEHGLEHEQKRGTLNEEQAEELRQKLRSLKTRRGRSY